MEILFQYKHRCVSGAVRRTSKAECEKCKPYRLVIEGEFPKHEGPFLTREGKLIRVTTATILMLMLCGCLDFNPNGGVHDKKNSNTSNTTFIYTYNNSGAPVAGAKVRDNVKIMVQVKDPTTGTYYDRQMDAGGWLLVKPESPLEAAPDAKQQRKTHDTF